MFSQKFIINDVVFFIKFHCAFFEILNLRQPVFKKLVKSDPTGFLVLFFNPYLPLTTCRFLLLCDSRWQIRIFLQGMPPQACFHLEKMSPSSFPFPIKEEDFSPDPNTARNSDLTGIRVPDITTTLWGLVKENSSKEATLVHLHWWSSWRKVCQDRLRLLPAADDGNDRAGAVVGRAWLCDYVYRFGGPREDWAGIFFT
jgi:hypothetical protein